MRLFENHNNLSQSSYNNLVFYLKVVLKYEISSDDKFFAFLIRSKIYS